MCNTFVRFNLLPSLLFLLVVGCGETTEPVDTTVDQGLFGEWYYIDEFFADHPAPEVEVQGIRIAADLSLKDLGVETETGKLAVWDTYPTDIYAKDVVTAGDGTMIVRYTSQREVAYDTLLYTIHNDTLTLGWPDNPVKLVYAKSTLGATVREPIQAQFEVLIEAFSNSPLKAFNIFPYPASYASRISESTLMLKAWLPQTKMEILLDDFHGAGEYTIPAGEYVLHHSYDDYIELFAADSAGAGTVTIERYDEAADICSGTFALHLRSASQVVELKEGTFSVPIYK